MQCAFLWYWVVPMYRPVTMMKMPPTMTVHVRNWMHVVFAVAMGLLMEPAIAMAVLWMPWVSAGELVWPTPTTTARVMQMT